LADQHLDATLKTTPPPQNNSKLPNNPVKQIATAVQNKKEQKLSLKTWKSK
jgi:hypothetical protein